MKKLIAILLALASASHAAKSFVLAGQSNMGGEGFAPHLVDLANKVGGVQVYFNPINPPGYWIMNPATEFSGNTPNLQFGPEIGIATFLKKRYPGETIYLIKLAWPATCLGCSPATTPWPGTWLDENSRLWQWFKEGFENAKSTNPNLPAKIDGIFWMQGEGDASELAASYNYAANLSTFVSRIRSYTNSPNAPFIFGQIQNWNMVWGSCGNIVQSQQLLAETLIPNSKLIRQSSDLPVWTNSPMSASIPDPADGKEDPYHYNTQGQLMLGRAFGIAASSAMPSEFLPGTISILR